MSPPTPSACYGATNPTPAELASRPVQRFASMIGLDAEKEQYYRELHGNVWPAVIARLRASHIQNYSIWVTEIEGRRYLFSYMEYTGDDRAADMRAMAEDPETQRWWLETDPCQFQLPSRQPGANWSVMEMVFRME
ncbi:MAG: L-rhamnose mutarotase [Chloroflexota bacterium]